MLDSNSIWPSNGIIGSEQIQIPDGINTKWPEGDALVGNFVYKEGKLAGFVDCKSLVINDSKTTVIPYYYAELELPSILKDTMTITGGERCKNLIVNCLEDAAVFITPMMKEILGDAKFLTEFIKEENKLIVHTDRLDDEILTTVSELLERVLPQFIEVYYDPFPLNYTRVEYIENPYLSYLDIAVEYSSEASLKIDFRDNKLEEGGWGKFPYLFGGTTISDSEPWNFAYTSSSTRWVWNGSTVYDYTNKINKGQRYILEMNKNGGYLDGVFLSRINYSEWVAQSITLFKLKKAPYSSACEMYSAQITENGKTLLDLVPCLDETGAPCMFDLVSRKPFYNKGQDDFLYPTDAAPAAAIGMDDKFYAKLTKHGVRRLYKVPDGCNMTKDDYAAANGFKEIVEPPKPEEGYWTPEWTETDTQLILQWIETEPPTII